MSNTRKLLEALGKKIELKDAEAAVIEELLEQEITPQRRAYDEIDGRFAGFVLPVSVNQHAESVVCSFQQFGPQRITQTQEGGKVQTVDLDDLDMDRITALWIRYKIEMIRKG